MVEKHVVVNAVLWASAIVASAMLGAPSFMSVILLPSLAAISLLVNIQTCRTYQCRHWG